MILKKLGIEKKDLLIPASILVGAVFIAFGIFLSSGKSFSNGDKVAIAKNDQQNTQQNTGNVKVDKRDNAATIGKGKVQVIEFSDFQCPYCKQFYTEVFGQLKTKYIDTNKITFTFRNFPLPFHQNAEKAAEAGECANRQGKFWQYHDTLFEKANGDGTGLEIASLKKYASDLGLDTNKFNSCLDNGEAADVVKKDTSDGTKAGVSGTPTIVIDGKLLVGAMPYANFEQEIEAALKK